MLPNYIEFPSLGRVAIVERASAKRFKARWKKGEVCLTVPQGARLPDIEAALHKMFPSLLGMKNQLRYSNNQELRFPGITFVIRHSPLLSGQKIVAKPRIPVTYVELDRNINLDSEDVTRKLSDFLCSLAKSLAPTLLLDRANELAHRVGRRPAAWTISNGHRVLGTCYPTGVISLSYMLVFLPQHLRDYVVLHEIAHLSEMNHSEAFHTILNGYLQGTEAALTAELRHYRWPVYRR